MQPAAGQLATAFRSYHSGGTAATEAANVPLLTALAAGAVHLSLTCRELCAMPPQLLVSTIAATLISLDMSRNMIDTLPAGLGRLSSLELLDVSRNRLRALPAELPPELCSLIVLSNQLRRPERSLPLLSLAALPSLTLLDLRYNSKLGSATAATVLSEALPARCEVRITASQRQVMSGAEHGTPSRPPKPSAAQRDATQLRCQLEPISTPQLRGRLDRLFGQPTHPDTVDRDAVLTRLVEAYGMAGTRRVRRMRGVLPRDDAPLDVLLAELRAMTFPTGAQRERPKVKSEVLTTHYPLLATHDSLLTAHYSLPSTRYQGYMILPRPLNGAAASEAVHASEADPRGADWQGGDAANSGDARVGDEDGGSEGRGSSVGGQDGGVGGQGSGDGGESGGGRSKGGGGGGKGCGIEEEGHVKDCAQSSAHQSSETSRLAAAKLRRHARIWDLAHEIIAGVDVVRTISDGEACVVEARACSIWSCLVETRRWGGLCSKGTGLSYMDLCSRGKALLAHSRPPSFNK